MDKSFLENQGCVETRKLHPETENNIKDKVVKQSNLMTMVTPIRK